MKKFIFSVMLLLLSGSLRAGGWGAAPPFTAAVNASISGATAWGTSSSNPGFLVAWYKDPGNAWHGLSVINAGGSGQRLPTSGYANVPSFTVTSAGTYVLAIYSSSSSSTSGSPSGNLEVSQNISVSSGSTATTFTFSNLNFTYDGTVKSATVTPTPSIATYTASLSRGPGPGSYTVTATATGSFTGSGSATLVINNVAPTISWFNPQPLPAPGVTYTVQATGNSASGTLSSVNVWKDGVPFAFNGTSSPYLTRTSDPNSVNDIAGTTHVFTAQATTSDGLQSPIISMTVKAVSNSSLSWADLQGAAPVNPSGTANPWLPYTGNITADSARLNSVINNLNALGAGGDTSTKVLQFDDKTYKYNAQTNGGMQSFSHIRNLSIIGGVHGQTVLNWAVRDSSGNPYDPAYGYSAMFRTDTPVWNPYFTNANLAYQPHGFFIFDEYCGNVFISNLTFDTDYTIRIGGEGSHIKMAGNVTSIQGNRITNCRFYHATGFAVFIGQTGIATNISFDANSISNTWADGVHVLNNSSNIWIVGNSFVNTGDDAIALTKDGSCLPTNVYIQWNQVLDSHWRGILVQGGNKVVVEYNYVSGTATTGILVEPSPDGFWNSSVQLQYNYLEDTGDRSNPALKPHNDPGASVSANWGRGYDLSYVHNLHANFQPRSDAAHPYSSYNSTAGTADGAFLTYIDNGGATPSYYKYGCEYTHYLTDFGSLTTGFVLGTGTTGLPTNANALP